MLSIREDSRLGRLLDELRELSKNNGESMEKTFARWSAEYLLNLEETMTSHIVDVHDADIDLDLLSSHRIDNNDPHIYWGKIIFDEKFEMVCNKKHIEDHINLFKNLDPKSYHDEYSKNVPQICDALTNLDCKPKYVIIVTGTISNDALDFKDDQISKKLDLEIYSIDDILNQISKLPAKDLSLKYENSYALKEESTIGHIKAKQIIDICMQDKNIFSFNPREYLGRTIANKSMDESLKDSEDKKIFWKLNNGITAICEKIIKSDVDNHEYSYKNFKIVNGRQTTHVLIDNKNIVTDDVKLLLSVHVADDDQRDKISKATNTQNPIKPVDEVTNNKFMMDFENSINENYKNWYFERQRRSYYGLPKETQELITLDRVLTKIDMLRQYHAFNAKPYNAVKYSQKQLFELRNLEKIFNIAKPMDFIIPHIFKISLNQVKKKYVDDEIYDLLRFQTVKYYVLALIGYSMQKMNPQDLSKCHLKIYDLFDTAAKSDKLMEIAKLAYLRFKRSSATIIPIDPDKFLDKNRLSREIDLNRSLISKDEFNTIKIQYDLITSEDIDVVLNKLKNL